MTERPVLTQVNLVVSEMGAATDFYRRLGLVIPASEPPWDQHHQSAETDAGIDVDLDSRTFAGRWNAGWPAGTSGVVLGFSVAARESVDAIYADLIGAGYEGQQPPYDAFWGARYAVASDPDGNAVGIMSPMDPDRRTEGPEPG